jgi:hypothetical protein
VWFRENNFFRQKHSSLFFGIVLCKKIEHFFDKTTQKSSCLATWDTKKLGGFVKKMFYFLAQSLGYSRVELEF